MNEITSRLERITELSADELATLADDIRAAYEAARNPEPDADGSAVVDFKVLEAFRDGLVIVAERQTEMAAAEAEALERLAALDAEVGAIGTEAQAEEAPADAETDPEADEAVVAEAEAIVADAAETATDEGEAPAESEDALARAAAALRSVRVPAAPAPADAPEAPAAVALVHSYDDGTPLADAEVSARMASAVRRYGKVAGREVRVASITASPEIPRISAIEDPRGWFDQQLADLRAHRQASAAKVGTRQASGTLCAPSITDYTVVALGTEDQPVGSLFPTAVGTEADQAKTLEFFQALGWSGFTDSSDRKFGDDAGDASAATAGIGSATATQNALTPGATTSPYPKTALRIDCLTPATCEQRAIWLELVWDNLNAAAWPEFVAAGDKAGRVALAKELEELRLQDWYDAADAADLVLAAQTIGQPYGANHSMVQALVTLATYDRRNKRDPGAQYVATIPDWAEAALATEMLAMLDIASGSMSVDQAKAELLTRFGITVSTYHDSFGKTTAAKTTSNGFSTALAELSASALTPQFPAEARIGLARDDAAFRRMGGELNLGVLRTETDLERNDWRSFFETWERLCFRVPPIVADVRVNASAHTAGSVSAVVDNAGGSGS